MSRAKVTRQPLLWAATAFAAGIAAGVYAWRPSLWWLIAAVVFLAAAAWFRQRRMGWVLVLGAYAALGAWSVGARDAGTAINSLSGFADGEPVTVTAHVVRDGILHGRAPWQRQSVDLETEQVEREGRVVSTATGVRLSIYAHGEFDFRDEESAAPETAESALPHVLTYGQRLRFTAKLREPHNFQNPGAWDYRGYLLGQGVVAIGSAAAGKVELLPGAAGTRYARWRSQARRSVLNKIHQLWPGPQAGLLDAMLIGERSFIARDTTAAWQRTGIYHILVVSGMNVGILAVVIFATLRRFRAGELLATVLTILLSIGYAYLAESGTPILRSVLMLTVFLCTRLIYRDRALLNALGAAALVLLAVDPRTLFEASFQLTFVSVLAIAGLAVPVLERTSGPVRRGLRWLFLPAYDLSLTPRVAQLRLDLRMIAEGIARLSPLKQELVKRAVGRMLCGIVTTVLSLMDVVVVSLAAQLAMTLPMAYYFHRATVVGLPANILAVPLTGILMSSSALALLLAYVWLPLAKLPALVAGWSLAGISGTVKVFSALRLADLRLPNPSPHLAFAAGAAFLAALFLVRRRAPFAVFGVALLLGMTVWLTLAPAPPAVQSGVLEVTGVDVGQAECFLVITPQGRTVLVDAAGPLGPFQSDFDFGEDVIAPYLWSRGIARLDAVALTHAHSDHMGGMKGVITAFHPRELWLGPNAPTHELRDLLETAAAYQVRVVPRAGGQQFDFGGARVEVMAPPPDWEVAAKPRNNDSLVLRISFGATSALLTGDAEKQVENALLARPLRATLLKVAHNGSRTSTTPEFLKAVHPQFALISVGAHNSFGHPRQEVLERLSQARVATYRTDTAGAVTFILDGNSVVARPSVLR